MSPHPDHLPFSPAAERNQAPLLDVLRRVLPPHATVLEIASGTGQHAAHFAAAQPQWRWQPTDADAALLPGIAARCAGRAGVLAPLRLDVLEEPWPTTPAGFDAVCCANLLHISPPAATAALLLGAAQQLVANGVLVVYGPFFVGGEPPAPGNLAFDADLRARHRDWGVRRLDDVVRAADRVGLAFEQRHDLPANNLALVFRLGGAAMTAQDDTSARRPAFPPFNPSAGPETQR